MGYVSALDAAAQMELRAALSWHLGSNHYPPVPLSMIDPCIEAIEAYTEGNFNREITLPEGVSWRGEKKAPAWAVIEGHHLEAFLPDFEPLDAEEPSDEEE